jgi:hypothetical protein
MKELPDVIPKNKNGLYQVYVIPTTMFTSLLPTDAVFTQLSNYSNRDILFFMSGVKGIFSLKYL